MGEEAIRIEAATLTDLPELMHWREIVLREVFELSPDEDLTELLAENRRYYEQALSEGSHVACFACEGEAVVGCGAICLQREMPSPDNPNGRCAYLMNIFTLPTKRGRGVGKKVVSWLIEQARLHGAGKVYLETTPSGRPLYERLGFIDLPDMMHLL